MAASERLWANEGRWLGPQGSPPTGAEPPAPAMFPRPQAPRTRGGAERSATVTIGAAALAPVSPVGAGLLVVLGALMTWASVSAGLVDVSAAGTNGDGRITLAFAILATVAAGISIRSSGVLWMAGAGAAFVVTLGVSIVNAVHVSSTRVADSLVAAQVGIGAGLWLCLVGSVIGVAASAYLVLSRSP